MKCVEILYHFTCNSCKNWWSIAMEKTGWKPKKMWCPHCGCKQTSDLLDFEEFYKERKWNF